MADITADSTTETIVEDAGRVAREPRATGYTHDIIVAGASTGGVEALSLLVRGLPADLDAAVFVVLHLSPQSPSHLPEILSRRGPLPASHPRDGEAIQRGHIYVAPPDRHLLIEAGRVRVVYGPKENRFRPAVDALFRSAALAYGARVAGVVLTGALDDGAAGLWAIKQWGGIAVVQDPREAMFAGMPESALEYVAVDYCVSVEEMGPLLGRLAREPAPGANPVARAARTHEAAVYLSSMTGGKMTGGKMTGAERSMEKRSMETESEIAAIRNATQSTQGGTLSGYVCPECNGPLWELRDGMLVRFRCRVGHAFSRDSMLASQADALDETLWTAYETLCESALLAERFAAESRDHGRPHVAERLEERARAQRRRAERLRGVIGDGDDTVPLDGAAGQEQAEAAQP